MPLVPLPYVLHTETRFHVPQEMRSFCIVAELFCSFFVLTIVSNPVIPSNHTRTHTNTYTPTRTHTRTHQDVLSVLYAGTERTVLRQQQLANNAAHGFRITLKG